MFRPTTIALLLSCALIGSACDSDEPTTPTTPTPPEQFTRQFTGTLTINGGRTHPFDTQRGGQITATLVSVTPDTGANIGFSIGTWNGVACQVVIANDNARVGTNVIGTAAGTGNFCVRIYDVGTLSQAVDYSITVVHF